MLSVTDRATHPELWYGAYALLGAVIAGLIPIMIPLLIDRAGSAPQVGLVMAAVSSGMLTAPLWGALADRYGRHHGMFLTGIALLSAALAVFPLLSDLRAWLPCAFLLGAGGSVTATVAGLFVVEFHPKAEWAKRLGNLQMFYGGGQVAGLVLAGLVHTDPSSGLRLAALLSAAAIGFALRAPRSTPAPRTHPMFTPAVHCPATHHPATHHVGMPTGLIMHYHLPHLGDLSRTIRSFKDPFGSFLTVWFFAVTGASSLFAFYPVLMPKVYGVGPDLASWGYAVAVACSLPLYRLTSSWLDVRGAAQVLRTGLGARLLAYVGLGVLTFGSAAGGLSVVAPALALFGFSVLAWSFLSVAGTNQAAGLSQLPQGEALGLFNAVAAVAGVSGSLLGSAVAAWVGYGGVPWLAALGVSLALVTHLKSRA